MDSSTIIILLGILIVLVIAALYISGTMGTSILMGGAPFIPTKHDRVKRMVELANLKSSDRIVDLGSGDGRLVVAALKAGAAHGRGIEILPHLNVLARAHAREHNVHDRAAFVTGSMWNHDLSDRTIVFAYQIGYAMNRLATKFETELAPGTRIICNAFDIPHWTPVYEEPGIYIYEIGKHKTPG